MTSEEAAAVATRFIAYLRTGDPPPGLFAETAFCDFTLPKWRVQAEGQAAVLALRRAGHPQPGEVPRWRCDPTPTGFVLEVEERWHASGQDWYCRELFRADVEGSAIVNLAVYCTGDWDAATQSNHARTVQLLRP